MKWNAILIIQYRKQTGFSRAKMADLLNISRPTYYRLEEGIKIEKYEHKLNYYYNAGYTLKQKEILLELGLKHLIEENDNKNTDNRRFNKEETTRDRS